MIFHVDKLYHMYMYISDVFIQFDKFYKSKTGDLNWKKIRENKGIPLEYFAPGSVQ